MKGFGIKIKLFGVKKHLIMKIMNAPFLEEE